MKSLIILLLVVIVIPTFISSFIIFTNICSSHIVSYRKAALTVFSSILFDAFISIAILATVTRTNPQRLIGSLKSMINLNCSYQDLGRLAMANTICVIVVPLITMIIYSLIYQKPSGFKIRPKGIVILLYLFSSTVILLSLYYSASESRNLSIDEVCRKKTGNQADESYIYIKNNGDLSCSTKRLYLSDSDRYLKSQELVETQIAPKESLKIILAGKGSPSIKKNGNSTLYLSDSIGIIDSLSVPPLMPDQSYVNTPSGWKTVNNNAFGVSSPIFSAESGFYSKPFNLSILSPDGHDIYYTLDGTVPTLDSIRYSGPIKVVDRSPENNSLRNIRNVIPNYKSEWDESNAASPVDKAFIVRAVCIDSNGECSPVVTNSFFINLDKYKSSNVISLVADPEDLFGENGIYSNGAEYDQWNETHSETDTVDEDDIPEANWEKSGMDWERVAVFDYYENGEEQIKQLTGIRIQGHGSRENALKRFSVFSRKQYSGSKYFDKSLFSDGPTHSVVLRPGNHQALIQALCSDRDVLTMPSKRITLFLNGEFWYEAFMFEKPNLRYISNHYNVNTANIAIVKNGQHGTEVHDGSNPYELIYEFPESNPLEDNNNYSKYDEIIDIQSFIDSTCIQVYIANMDYQEEWNNYLWHTIDKEDSSYGDTRWRWGLYDMDNNGQALSDEYVVDATYKINPFKMHGKYQEGPLSEWTIFSRLRANDEFCRKFVLSFMDIVNTVFRMDNVNEKIRKLQITDDNIGSFYSHRAEYVVPFVAEEFELRGTTGTVLLTSNRSGTPISLNTISPKLDNGKWDGIYFTDYPVIVRSNDVGFDHWEITSDGVTTTTSESEVEISVTEGGITINAIYE